WVDPEAPAELRGVCIETVYDYEAGHQDEVEVFAYPTVPIDVTPAGPGELRVTTLSLDRDTAAGGQLLAAEVGGCSPGDYVAVSVVADTDLALGGAARPVMSESTTAGEGPTVVELSLHDQNNHPGGPLTDGDYVVV